MFSVRNLMDCCGLRSPNPSETAGAEAVRKGRTVKWACGGGALICLGPCLLRRELCMPLGEDTVRGQPSAGQERALTRSWLWSLDLGLRASRTMRNEYLV